MARAKRNRKKKATDSPSPEPPSEAGTLEAEPSKKSMPAGRPGWPAAAFAAGVLALVLVALFRESLQVGRVLFANDAPLGFIKHYFENGGEGWGTWVDHTWIGYAYPAAALGFTTLVGLLGMALGADGSVWFANFYAPGCLWLAGMCAWVFFRQMGCGSAVCLLGALAAALNGAFFTYATWGLPVRALAAGMTFLALAALVGGRGRRWWPLAVLAGLAVGQGVMEAYDIGALFSLYAAAYAVFLVLNREGWTLLALGRGAAVVAVMAVFAGLMAWNTIASVRETQTQGIVNQEFSAEHQWNGATQWSLPKAETARLAVPGLFGYRMDSPPEQRYWGSVGQTPGWPEHRMGMPHHSGYGVYAGVLVLVVAVWGLVNSFRREDGPYSRVECRFIWFTATLAIISLGLAWGRHGFLYQLIYPLPFFNDIRNPIKFMQPFSLLLVILFGLGLQGIARLYLEDTRRRVKEAGSMLSNLFQPGEGFEKTWAIGSGVFFMAAAALSLALMTLQGDVAVHISRGLGLADEQGAKAMAAFGMGQIWRTLLLLLMALLLLLAVPRLRWSPKGVVGLWAALGILLVVDLGSAHGPYIKYWNLSEKYPSNPVLEKLAGQSTQGRTALLDGQRFNLAVPTPGGPQVVQPSLEAHVLDVLLAPLPPANQVFTNASLAVAAENFHRGILQCQTSADFQQFVQSFSASHPSNDPELMQFCSQQIQQRGLQLRTKGVSGQLASVYGVEWAQHQMPWHGVPMLDIVQEPRPKLADTAFRTNLAPAVAPSQVNEAVRLALRKLELTSTRYIVSYAGSSIMTQAARRRLGDANATSALNAVLDPRRQRFRPLADFNIVPVPAGMESGQLPVSYSTSVTTNGKFAVTEFRGALPRAKLYADWKQGASDREALERLASAEFDPQTQVVLAENGLPQPSGGASPGPVEYVVNHTKYIELKTPPTEKDTILLLNDRHNPDWQVFVNGQPSRLLRANFLMRAVHLPPSAGGHEVVFRYQPTREPVLVSALAALAGLAFGVVGLRRAEDENHNPVG
ncbi:MAG: hypothetical protein CMO74_09075 [Verrucomicrobiales bacterium]|nr:hypothetical protein [Verrucomicrobiales bacterium]